uniref:Uncharacterized protein n=1 Tax=Rhizophora mucronata TaxID=61149 RepID=A0A2P2K0T0_RHIMU
MLRNSRPISGRSPGLGRYVLRVRKSPPSNPRPPLF